MIIHTDTHIWYAIKEGKHQELFDLGVRPNYLNYFEINSSLKMIHDLDKLKVATINLIKFLDVAIKYTPFEFLIKESKNIDVANAYREDLFNSYESLGENIEIFKYIKTIDPDILKKFILEDRNTFIETAKTFSIFLNGLKNEKKTIPVQFFYHMFDIACKKDCKYPLPIEFYDKELFIKVLSEYTNDFILGNKKTVKKNDWIDLLNMAYVDKGDLYWVKETQWLEYIDRANLKHYLFDGDKYLIEGY
ncbi:MAG: hypothetical protein CFE24_15170 [Flavobacterium sp. BFFFF2]|nr:MAG: hypothetical protein CFE24_15170 [Flavobacterium sp. BFFFF2]